VRSSGPSSVRSSSSNRNLVRPKFALALWVERIRTTALSPMQFGVNQRCREGARAVDEARPPDKSALLDDRIEVIETDRRCVSLAGEAVSQCGVGRDDLHLAGEQASEGDAEAFLCHRRIRRACSSD